MIWQKKRGLRRPMKRRSPRRRKKSLNFKTWMLAGFTVVALAALLLTGSVVLGYNPFLEGRLKGQFGDDFFTNFGELPDRGDGESLEEVIDNYEPAFQTLEDEALRRLDMLFQEAIAEYQAGDGTVDRFMLTNKYIQAGRMLEENVDETFYELLEEMESELSRKGYSKEILKEIETTYEQAKDNKKRELMNRLRQAVGS